jgi:hypothetical protein
MARWTLDDIAWNSFDRARLDSDIVRIIKAAALVEYNGAAYAGHLCRVFADDPGFQESARQWGEEEIQHGQALGRWAELADPDFDFAAAVRRFRDGFRVDFASNRSRRGSRAGEMVARCIVETGTSSYYSALRDAVQEPVLREICRNIAADEVRHYKLFYATLSRYAVTERIGRWRRLRIVLGRLAEVGDDELAYAYYAANEWERPYDRRRCARAYTRRTIVLYRQPHIVRAVKLVFGAIGFAPHSRLSNAAGRLAWAASRLCARRG